MHVVANVTYPLKWLKSRESDTSAKAARRRERDSRRKGQARPQYHVIIRDLPASERPQECLCDHGSAYLSNAKLIAILLRTGTTSENVVTLATLLLSQYGGLEGLAKTSFRELSNQHGMEEAKTSQIKAVLEFGKPLLSTNDEQRVTSHSP